LHSGPFANAIVFGRAGDGSQIALGAGRIQSYERCRPLLDALEQRRSGRSIATPDRVHPAAMQTAFVSRLVRL
jgi:hypothetical protein